MIDLNRSGNLNIAQTKSAYFKAQELNIQLKKYRTFGTALCVVLFMLYGNVGRYLIFNPFVAGSVAEATFFDFFFTRSKYVICFLVILYGVTRPIRSGYDARTLVFIGPFLAWSILSAVWSADFNITMRSSIQLFGFVTAVAVLCARIGPSRVAACCIATITVACVASAFCAVFLPEIGLHQSTDPLQSIHAGLWRGIMGHKNLLGPYAALASVLLFTSHRLIPMPIWLLWLCRASALSCFVFSGSVAALPAAASMFLLYFVYRDKRMLTLSGALVVIGFLIGAVALSSAFGGVIASALGRDPTFSGRTLIWARAMQVWFEDGFWLGQGYGASSLVVVPILTRELFASATSAHNGYINVLLDVGLVGFIGFLVAVVAAVSKAMTSMSVAIRSEIQQRRFFDTKLAMLIALTGNLVGAIAEYSILGALGVGHVTFVAIVVLMCEPINSGKIVY